MLPSLAAIRILRIPGTDGTIAVRRQGEGGVLVAILGRYSLLPHLMCRWLTDHKRDTAPSHFVVPRLYSKEAKWHHTHMVSTLQVGIGIKRKRDIQGCNPATERNPEVDHRLQLQGLFVRAGYLSPNMPFWQLAAQIRYIKIQNKPPSEPDR